MPLVVDLDGTLIRSDLLQESFARAMFTNPISALHATSQIFRGKGALKRHLAEKYSFAPETLPYNNAVLDYVRQAKNEGRQVILASGSNELLVGLVAQHLGHFDDVLASTASENLTGAKKLQAIRARLGSDDFEYLGNASVDFAIWEVSKLSGIVSNSGGKVKRLLALSPSAKVFEPEKLGVSGFLRALRLHQWVKNLLLFIPLVAAFKIDSSDAWIKTFLGFLAFSLLASASYLVNDLADIENDRANHLKRFRPFANGTLSVGAGSSAALALLLLSFGVAFQIGGNFTSALAAYLAITLTYSFGLKRLALLDIVAIALLFTLRIVAGGAAASVNVSFWLLILSFFLFTSFALVKRYAELEHIFQAGGLASKGRGYKASDLPLIETMGIASGFVAVLVLALYLDSNIVRSTYALPELGLLALPAFLLLIGRIWLKAHRGEMHQDPIVFALRDFPSLATSVLLVACLVISHFGVPW